MTDELKDTVTRILHTAGESADLREKLLPLVYQQLRAIAQRKMLQERPDHTLQATALVHEAYLRLIGDRGADWQGKQHFYAAAAEAMRRVLRRIFFPLSQRVLGVRARPASCSMTV